jgi:hypothetical protein
MVNRDTDISHRRSIEFACKGPETSLVPTLINIITLQKHYTILVVISPTSISAVSIFVIVFASITMAPSFFTILLLKSIVGHRYPKLNHLHGY